MGRSDLRMLAIPGGIFGLALAVRAAYLIDSASSPTFHAPVVDASRYDELARALAAGGTMGPEHFWQPFLYPFLLSLVYSVSGSSIVFAKIAQAVLGSVTCVLTWSLGKKTVGPIVGALAALILASYGPLVFFETELLATGLATFWAVLLCLLFGIAAEKRRAWLFFLLGVCAALAVLTRPTFLPFVLIASGGLLFSLFRASGELRSVALATLWLGLGFVVACLPVTVHSARLTGTSGMLPLSSGLNLHVGNNPEYCSTASIRPGREWQQLVDEPVRHGVARTPLAHRRFFEKRVARYLLDDPLGFAKGWGRKALRLVDSREIPRNVDVYVAAKWSRVLRILVFRVGRFGLPFGLLFPLAIVGIVHGWRKLGWPLLLFLPVYGLSVVAVLASARYRLPMIPLMAVSAASGLVMLGEMIRHRRGRLLAATSALIAGTLLLTGLPGPFCEERAHHEAEMLFAAGAYNDRHGRSAEAIQRYDEAVALWPEFFEAHNNLGILCSKEGLPGRAIHHYRRALAIEPGFSQAHISLAYLLLERGEDGDAIHHLGAYLRIRPDDAPMQRLIGQQLFEAGRYAEAEEHYRQAVALMPDDPHSLNGLAWLLTGEDDPSTARPEEAVMLARRAAELTEHGDARILDTLAVALAAKGECEDALVIERQALRLVSRDGDGALADVIRTRIASYERQVGD